MVGIKTQVSPEDLEGHHKRVNLFPLNVPTHILGKKLARMTTCIKPDSKNLDLAFGNLKLDLLRRVRQPA
jgi:hypothetical protein